MVMNALDNRAARSHVNRMCLAANIPLVESGTAGYKGNVSVRVFQQCCILCNLIPIFSFNSCFCLSVASERRERVL